MKTLANDVVANLRTRLIGLECWYANTGGASVGNTFSLALGAKILRERPLNNVAHPEVYRNFEGEANLVVWCTWRLDGQDAPESSSDDTDEGIRTSLEAIIGSRIVDVIVERPAWDLQLLFSPFRRLHVFCDHIPGDPSFDGNWELHTQDEAYYFGPGAAMESERR